ncbi:hypothetical protein CLCAR_2063 [Clostridium carboxidivorans P7]|nr:hypothetical protein CLCAR_2063 [Clostridium carboxidivorans P7]
MLIECYSENAIHKKAYANFLYLFSNLYDFKTMLTKNLQSTL